MRPSRSPDSGPWPRRSNSSTTVVAGGPPVFLPSFSSTVLSSPSICDATHVRLPAGADLLGDALPGALQPRGLLVEEDGVRADRLAASRQLTQRGCLQVAVDGAPPGEPISIPPGSSIVARIWLCCNPGQACMARSLQACFSGESRQPRDRHPPGRCVMERVLRTMALENSCRRGRGCTMYRYHPAEERSIETWRRKAARTATGSPPAPSSTRSTRMRSCSGTAAIPSTTFTVELQGTGDRRARPRAWSARTATSGPTTRCARCGRRSGRSRSTVECRGQRKTPIATRFSYRDEGGEEVAFEF